MPLKTKKPKPNQLILPLFPIRVIALADTAWAGVVVIGEWFAQMLIYLYTFPSTIVYH